MADGIEIIRRAIRHAEANKSQAVCDRDQAASTVTECEQTIKESDRLIAAYTADIACLSEREG